MIAYWGRDLICLHANQSYLAWFGRGRDQVVGHHLRDVIGEIPFSLNRPHISAVLNGEPQTFEREVTRADGQIVISSANYVPDFEDGHVRGFYVLLSDITDLRRTEQRLRESEADLKKLLQDSRESFAWQSLAEQVAHLGHWRVNLLDQSVVWSQEVYRIHDLTPDTFSPTVQTALAFYHEDDRLRVSELVGRAVETGLPFEFDARLVRRNGLVRTVRSRGMAMADNAGRPTSLFGVFIDITEQVKAELALRAANEHLEAEVNRDALTGLANRRRFDATLERAWHAARHAETPVSLVMIDVDHFKSFNDRYGHQAGDDCLRAVGAAITTILRQHGDEAARYGGEEFAVLLPGADESGGAAVAERARFVIEALRLTHAGTPYSGSVVTASLGVATARPHNGGSMAELLREADSRLYEAKRAGRNRLVSRSTVIESVTGRR